MNSSKIKTPAPLSLLHAGQVQQSKTPPPEAYKWLVTVFYRVYNITTGRG